MRSHITTGIQAVLRHTRGHAPRQAAAGTQALTSPATGRQTLLTPSAAPAACVIVTEDVLLASLLCSACTASCRERGIMQTTCLK